MTARTPAPVAVSRVTTLELFFDLVFVFTVTQVTHLVAHAHAPFDFLRAFLLLAVIWWMYGGYAWLTTNLGTSRLEYRLFLLCAMAAYLVIALRIPAVAGRHGPALGLAYLVVVLVHLVLFTKVPNSSARAILSIAPFNLAIALALLATGFAGGRWSWLLWIAAVLPIVASTVLRRERGFHLNPAHFAERNGLVVLVALGESVVAIGTGAADLPLGFPVLAAAVLGLALAAGIWWSYFDRDDVRAEHALSGVAGDERARMGFYAYYHAHLLMIAGIVTAAAGVEQLMAQVGRSGSASAGYLLSIGIALYLFGEAAFRWLLRIGSPRGRVVAAGVALALIPMGTGLSPLAHLLLLVALLVAMLVLEARQPEVREDVAR